VRDTFRRRAEIAPASGQLSTSCSVASNIARHDILRKPRRTAQLFDAYSVDAAPTIAVAALNRHCAIKRELASLDECNAMRWGLNADRRQLLKAIAYSKR